MLDGIHLCDIAPGQHSFLPIVVARVVSFSNSALFLLVLVKPWDAFWSRSKCCSLELFFVSNLKNLDKPTYLK